MPPSPCSTAARVMFSSVIFLVVTPAAQDVEDQIQAAEELADGDGIAESPSGPIIFTVTARPGPPKSFWTPCAAKMRPTTTRTTNKE